MGLLFFGVSVLFGPNQDKFGTFFVSIQLFSLSNCISDTKHRGIF